MQPEEGMRVPISEAANVLLDQMPFLKPDQTVARDHPDNAKRAVVRGAVRPLAYFLIEHPSETANLGIPLSRIQTPEELIAAVVAHPGLELEPERKRHLLEEFGPGQPRDWKTIAFAMTMQDDHPLSRLSQMVKASLTPQAWEELTRAELSSY